MKTSVKERLIEFLNEKAIRPSQFEKMCGLSNGYLSKLRQAPSSDKLEVILSKFPELNRVWLLSGDGEMLNEGCQAGSGDPADMVPVIHIDSVGGVHSQNDILSPEYVERYCAIEGARPGDFAIYQSGTSMSPGIPPGSLLLLREVPEWHKFIGYDNVFVLLLDDGRRITKRIRRYDADPKTYYWCVSDNPDVADEELPRSMICRVWRVVKVLIDFGW